MLADDLLHKRVEAVVDVQKLLHCCAGQVLKNRDEVCRVTAGHHLAKLIAEVHQVEQLLVVVVVASAEAHATDHIGNGDDNVTEGVEAAIGLHDSVELLDQILCLFADMFLQRTGVLWCRAFQGGEGAQGTVGQLPAGTPDASLVSTEGQTLAIVDKPEAVQVRPARKLVPLLDESLADCFTATQHDDGTHANLDLEDVAVALAHGSETQVRISSHLKHVPNDGQGLRSGQLRKPLGNLSTEKLEDHVDQTHGYYGHQTLRHRHRSNEWQHHQHHDDSFFAFLFCSGLCTTWKLNRRGIRVVKAGRKKSVVQHVDYMHRKAWSNCKTVTRREFDLNLTLYTLMLPYTKVLFFFFFTSCAKYFKFTTSMTRMNPMNKKHID